jgi:predicted transcriptional regulator
MPRKPPSEPTYEVSARFPPDVFAQIVEIATADRRSYNFVVNQLVAAELDRRNTKTAADA